MVLAIEKLLKTIEKSADRFLVPLKLSDNDQFVYINYAEYSQEDTNIDITTNDFFLTSPNIELQIIQNDNIINYNLNYYLYLSDSHKLDIESSINKYKTINWIKYYSKNALYELEKFYNKSLQEIFCEYIANKIFNNYKSVSKKNKRYYYTPHNNKFMIVIYNAKL